MSEFNPGEFMVEPTVENFNSLRKDDLVTLGKHLGLEIRSTLRKCEVYNLIKKHFVKEKTFEQSVFMEQSITTFHHSRNGKSTNISYILEKLPQIVSGLKTAERCCYKVF